LFLFFVKFLRGIDVKQVLHTFVDCIWGNSRFELPWRHSYRWCGSVSRSL